VAPAPVSSEGAAAALEIGAVLSERYEILQLLGQGGMGAVYKAHDLELERVVALKVIRPDLSSDQKTLRRFKQELILARQVTHKNVIRIFDLGSHQGTKYITMEFVEGRDLSSILEERRLTPDESARLIRQVCRALESAHAENVVHRDLKPQNIMVDATGRARVMDFGLARSVEMSGLTRTGAILGTPAYMSPEQVLGTTPDARSDLFSLGIIFYELLTGKVPFKAETVWASLLARTREAAAPPVSVDPSAPQALSDITVRCLAIDPAARYQSASEMAADLDAWIGDLQQASIVMVPPSALPAPLAPPAAHGRNRWIVAATVVVLLAGAAAIKLLNRPPAAPPRAVSVLVGDFTNLTGDPVFENSLEPMFNIALEGASFINAYSRGEARRSARQLPNPTDKLDEQSARLVAIKQGVGAVVTGSLSLRGDGYKLTAEAIDAVSGKTIASSEQTVSGKDQVPLAIPKLAAPIRKALGDATPQSVQLDAARGTFTAASLEAVHQYGLGMEQQFAGKWQDALQSFTKATELDPNFARAYSGMATVKRNMQQPAEAADLFKVAMEHVDRMTERERYRTRGVYYLTIGNYPKCVEEYSSLVSQYPADNIGHANLAICERYLQNMPQALQEAQRAVELNPKSAIQLANLGLFSAYARDFQAAERSARGVQQLNPSLAHGYLILAYAQLGQNQFAQAADTYQALGKLSPLGAAFRDSGLADLAIYQGRFSEARRILEAGAADKDSLRRAEMTVALAYTRLLAGQDRPALQAAENALTITNKVNIRFLAARILVQAGEIGKAKELAAGLGNELNPEPRADAKLIEGEIALQQKNPQDAIRIFTAANELLDTWIGRFDLGRAYLDAGLFTEADSEFDRCIKRRGEALELDDAPTYGYVPAVYYFQGRVREGLKSPGFAEPYRTYLNIRGAAAEDPLLKDVQRRIGQ
jgi:tetratricopeptide (TPR) repeat protein